MLIQIFLMSKKLQQRYKIHSHGCLTEFLDWLSEKNPINQTKTKAKEVIPKNTST